MNAPLRTLRASHILKIRILSYPVSNRFMTIDIGTFPVRSSRWKWFGMRAQA